MVTEIRLPSAPFFIALVGRPFVVLKFLNLIEMNKKASHSIETKTKQANLMYNKLIANHLREKQKDISINST